MGLTTGSQLLPNQPDPRSPNPTTEGQGNVAATKRVGSPQRTAPLSAWQRHDVSAGQQVTRQSPWLTLFSHAAQDSWWTTTTYTVSSWHPMMGTVPPWHTMPWREEQEPDDHTRTYLQKQGQDMEGPPTKLTNFSLPSGSRPLRSREPISSQLSPGPQDYIRGARPSFRTIESSYLEPSISV
jgi:hypothetical protein